MESNTVVLTGVVEDRKAKRLAEDIAEDVWGAEDVRNELKCVTAQPCPPAARR